MTTYSWLQNAAIEKLVIAPFGDKGREAVLYASDTAEDGELSRIPAMFRDLGLSVVPDTEEGQHVLRIHGFESEHMLTEALHQNGFAPESTLQKQASPQKPKVKTSFSDRIRNNSLTLAGRVALVGDAALIASGILRKDMNETKTGLGYSSISLIHGRYGERKPEKAFEDLYQKMMKDFAKDGVELPNADTATVQNLSESGGIISRMEDFLYAHPTAVTNAISVFGGYQLFKAGRNQENMGKSAAGALVMIGMLTSLLVREKPKEEMTGDSAWQAPSAPPDAEGVIGKLTKPARDFADWVQEKPLRFSSYMSMANNVFLGAGTVQEWQGKKQRLAELDQQESDLLPDSISEERAELESDKHSWKLNMLTSMTYLISNSLISISSKDADKRMADGGGAEELKEIYAAAASVLAAQPEEVRDVLVRKTAYYLAEQKELAETPEEIEVQMHAKIEALADSPWLARVSTAPQDATSNGATR